MQKIDALVSALLVWFKTNARDLPWRCTRDPYAIWTSEIMLQQTQVKTVIPFWERWMCELPTIEAAANASSAKLHKLWEGLGYYTRVRNLQKAAQVIVQQHGGKFPAQFDDVLALPGIGRYTAGAICSIAFNQPTPLLDGNVIRVLTRVFGIAKNPKDKKTNAQLWKLAAELVAHASRITCRAEAERRRTHHENNSCSHLNQSLMELGALVCTPRNAQCSVCPVKKLCVAFRENRVEELPNLGQREQATARRFVAFVIEHNGKFLVRQRPAGIVNAHLWEFPNVEVNGGEIQATNPGASQLLSTRQLPTPKGLNHPAQGCDGKQGATLGKRHPNIFTTLKGLHQSGFCKNVPFFEMLPWRLFKATFGLAPNDIIPLVTIKHSITRYRITLEAFRAKVGNAALAGGFHFLGNVPQGHSKIAQAFKPGSGVQWVSSPAGTAENGRVKRARTKTEMLPAPAIASAVWKTPAQMRRLAFTSAHRKILRAL